MNREPINPLCLITKLVSLIEISCFSKRATPFCPIPARTLGLFLPLSAPLSIPSTEGFLLRKSEGETPRGERYLLRPFLPSRFLSCLSLVAPREIHEEERIYASRFEPRDPFSSSPRPNRSVTSPSRLRVFQRNAREEGLRGPAGPGGHVHARIH